MTKTRCLPNHGAVMTEQYYYCYRTYLIRFTSIRPGHWSVSNFLEIYIFTENGTACRKIKPTPSWVRFLMMSQGNTSTSLDVSHDFLMSITTEYNFGQLRIQKHILVLSKIPK